MEDEKVTIHLKLSLVGESLTGRAWDDHGITRAFDGRLGLLAAIDALMAASPTGSETSGDPPNPAPGASTSHE